MPAAQPPQEGLAGLSPAALALIAQRANSGDGGAATPSPIPRRAGALTAPLSSRQQQIWFFEQLEPGNAVHNLPKEVRFLGRLEVEPLERALGEVVRRHEILRTRYAPGPDGVLRQHVGPPGRSTLTVVDANGSTGGFAEAWREEATADALRPFDLSGGECMRAKLYRFGPEDHLLHLVFHHIGFDGWSTSVFLGDLGAAYDGALCGTPRLPPLSIQYGDFAVWETDRLESQTQQDELAYWSRRLAEAPPESTLPATHARPMERTYTAGQERARLGPDLVAVLQDLGRAENATDSIVLLCAFQLLLARHSGARDLVVGVPIAGRTRSEQEDLVGYFVNMVAVRTDFSGGLSFRQLLGRVRAAALEAFAHQSVPFDHVVTASRAPRSPGINPLFQVGFNYRNLPDVGPKFEGLEVQTRPGFHGRSLLDLNLDVTRVSDGLECVLTYSRELFDAASPGRLLCQLRTLLEAGLEDPDLPIATVPLLNAQERARLVEAGRGPWQAIPEACIHTLVEEQARRRPGSPAVIGDHGELSFAELNHQADHLAAALRATPSDPDFPVGVFVDRSPEQVVAVLGIFKAGRAYVPLDPSYPPDRLSFIAADSGVEVVVTTRRLRTRLPVEAAAVVCVGGAAPEASPPPLPVRRAADSPDRLAYVIYTSGSTGAPKGVEVDHRSVVNILLAERAIYGVRPTDRVLQFASINFDPSVTQMFTPLAAGAAVVVCTQAMLESIPKFLQTCAARGVTLMAMSTAFWHELVMCIEEDGLAVPPPVRAVIIGGEAARPDRLALWRRNVSGLDLFNNYGPTETTIWSAVQNLTRPVAGETSGVPIGYPLSNTDLYVLDEGLELTPPGAPGELFIGGAGVARGYRNRPELTAERFLHDPFSTDPASRIYRTGDVVRLREDGALDFLGRRDGQVKVRGFRIEPGEVEAALGRHPSVRETVVVPKQDRSGDLRLVAYVVPTRVGFDAEVLRAHLRQSLPEHMVPAAFVELASLPVSPNGKVDRGSLPAPESGPSSLYTPPQDPVEEVLCGIWEGVLGSGPIGRDGDFFELGGHSLAAMRVVGRAEAVLGREVPVRALFEHPTVARLAEYLRSGRSDVSRSPLPLDSRPGGPSPLSFAQRRLWFLDRLTPGRPTYNVPLAFRLTGDLDEHRLQDALRRIVQRHEPLRMRIREGTGEAVQEPTELPLFEWDAEDLAQDPDNREKRLRHRLREEAARPFDLRDEGPLRARLFRLGAQEHALFLNVHHMAIDGWSEDILYREMDACYRDPEAGRHRLPELPMGYGAYAAWQRRQEPLLRPALERWTERLKDVRALELPTDHARQAIPQQRGGVCRSRIPADLLNGFRQLTERERCTLHMSLLAVLQLLLGRLSGQHDVLVGTPVAGRRRPELEPLIGMFVNTLPIRVDLAGGPSFMEALRRVREATLAAYEDGDVPLEAIVEACQAERNGAGNTLVRVAFALQPGGPRVPQLDGLEVQRLPLHTATAKFDLFLAATPVEDGLHLRLEYDADLFRPCTAERFLELFHRLISGVVTNPAIRVDDLDLTGEEERAQVRAWNRTERRIPERPIHELFSEVAARTPEGVAVLDTRQRLTYGELDALSDAVAHRLVASGQESGERVGVCMDPGADLVIASLAILKAGGCYVPLDPEFPRQRLDLMVGRAGIRRIVTAGPGPPALRTCGAELLGLRPPGRTSALRATPPSPPRPGRAVTAHDLAYVLYTSGSTGQPKGVAVSHRAVVRLVRESDYIGLGPDDAVAQAASPSFDAATFEIWGALLNGARLVMVPRAVLLSPRELERTLAEHEVTTLFLTTALFNQVARERPGAFRSLRHLLFGGEAADAEAARRVLASGAPPQRLIHVYGPTENTTFSTWHTVLHVPPDATTLPIGRPIANSTAWVLDGCGRIQPLGVWGELHVGGTGVATGYLGGGTDESGRFLPDPFSSRPGARLYRTGDRARWTPEGELEFGGRLDAQVKLRGFRIEPAEVEGALRRCPGVVEAAVVVHGVGQERRLVAYVAGAEEIQGGQIRDQVRHQLPPYMVPSTVVVMPALPLTASGKLDRHALPAPTELSPPPTARPAGDPLEREIAAIWRTLLGNDSVGARESFFDLGGHSLLALEMIRRVEVATGREVGVDVLFEEPTIAHLARTIARAERSGGCPVVELRTGEAGVAPFFFFHGDFNGAGLYTRNLVESLDEAQPVYIVHPHQPGGPASIQDMAEDLLPALRSVRPRGPYLLGGHCNGGAVAFEVAQRLLAAGECVDLLVLVDVPGRNIGLAPYATLLERVGRTLHVPAARRHALFLATRGPVERLVYGLNTAAERAPGRVRRARAAVLVAWAADQTRRAGARLLRAVILRGGRPGAVEGHPGPVSERAERARYFAAAMQSYLPTHYAGRLVLITPAEPGSIPAWLRPELWARLCDSVEIRPVTGDHLSVLTEDIEPLGAVLGDLLRGPAHTVGA